MQNLCVVIKHLFQNFNLVSVTRVPNVDGCDAWVIFGPRVFHWCVRDSCRRRGRWVSECVLLLRVVL